jgi:hypothetical protein
MSKIESALELIMRSSTRLTTPSLAKPTGVRPIAEQPLDHSLPSDRSPLEWNHYLSGLIDGEGCFSVSFTLREKMRHGVEIRPSFSIGQSINKDNFLLLERVRELLGCGAIRVSKGDNCYKYETRNLTEIRERVIPFIESYPLYSSKRHDFILFDRVCSLLARKAHLTPEGIGEVIELAFSMNQSGTRKTTREKLLERIEERVGKLLANK